MSVWMFIAAVFIITKNWKQPNCLSFDEWQLMWSCIHTREYCSTISKLKKKTWFMRQHCSILNAFCEVKQSDSKGYCIIPFTCFSGKGKNRGTKNRLVVSREQQIDYQEQECRTFGEVMKISCILIVVMWLCVWNCMLKALILPCGVLHVNKYDIFLGKQREAFWVLLHFLVFFLKPLFSGIFPLFVSLLCLSSCACYYCFSNKQLAQILVSGSSRDTQCKIHIVESERNFSCFFFFP